MNQLPNKWIFCILNGRYYEVGWVLAGWDWLAGGWLFKEGGVVDDWGFWVFPWVWGCWVVGRLWDPWFPDWELGVWELAGGWFWFVAGMFVWGVVWAFVGVFCWVVGCVVVDVVDWPLLAGILAWGWLTLLTTGCTNGPKY